jgi:hypothetical protein
MTVLIFILGCISTGFAISAGDYGAVFAIWMAVGFILFVWQTICDATKEVTKAFGGEHYHQTQNVYEIVEVPEHPDPTRPDRQPNEALPAIITVAKYNRKGN